MKLISNKQAENIVELVIATCTKAQGRGELNDDEKEAIIQFTRSATASIKVLNKLLANKQMGCETAREIIAAIDSVSRDNE